MPVTVAMALMMEVIVAIVIVTVAASQKRISSIFYLQSFLIIHPSIIRGVGNSVNACLKIFLPKFTGFLNVEYGYEIPFFQNGILGEILKLFC